MKLTYFLSNESQDQLRFFASYIFSLAKHDFWERKFSFIFKNISGSKKYDDFVRCCITGFYHFGLFLHLIATVATLSYLRHSNGVLRRESPLRWKMLWLPLRAFLLQGCLHTCCCFRCHRALQKSGCRIHGYSENETQWFTIKSKVFIRNITQLNLVSKIRPL